MKHHEIDADLDKVDVVIPGAKEILLFFLKKKKGRKTYRNASPHFAAYGLLDILILSAFQSFGGSTVENRVHKYYVTLFLWKLSLPRPLYKLYTGFFPTWNSPSPQINKRTCGMYMPLEGPNHK